MRWAGRARTGATITATSFGRTGTGTGCIDGRAAVTCEPGHGPPAGPRVDDGRRDHVHRVLYQSEDASCCAMWPPMRVRVVRCSDAEMPLLP